MSDLEEIDYNRPHRISQKWEHYFPIYERYFNKFRQKRDFRMLEIGISQGGSLDVWRMYFGSSALIVGVDIDPRCRIYESGKTLIRIGSQEDRTFLRSIKNEFSAFDLIIDDGGHKMVQQTTTFEELYPSVRPGGIFLTEDVHTSYHAPFEGGLLKPNTFIEFSKRKIDQLNGHHIDAERDAFSVFSRSTYSISFYDSVVVFEKEVVPKPRSVEAGKGS